MDAFEQHMAAAGVPCENVGHVTHKSHVKISDAGAVLIDQDVHELRKIWAHELPRLMGAEE